jgi:hypothetical protein
VAGLDPGEPHGQFAQDLQVGENGEPGVARSRQFRQIRRRHRAKTTEAREKVARQSIRIIFVNRDGLRRRHARRPMGRTKTL